MNIQNSFELFVIKKNRKSEVRCRELVRVHCFLNYPSTEIEFSRHISKYNCTKHVGKNNRLHNTSASLSELHRKTLRTYRQTSDTFLY